MKRHIVLCLLAMFVFAIVCIVSPKKSVSASQQPKTKVSLDTEDGIVYVKLDTESCALKRLRSETAFVGKLELEEAIAKIPKVDNTLIKAEGSGNVVIISSDDYELSYSDPYWVTDNRMTRSRGVVYFNGHKETWYSIHEPGQTVTAKHIPGKHIASDDTIRDENGYICVASSDLPFYSVVLTSMGPGKVYDCGCRSGTIDIYTTW